MRSEKGLSLIIPAYNAEKFIEASLINYFSHFSRKFKKFEIIVVCNACSDKTYEKVLSLKERMPLIALNTPQRGKGNAVFVGLEHSEHEIIGFLDADNPYDLNEISNMLEFLDEFDLAMVTKFKNYSKYQTSLTRRVLSISGALVFRILFGMNFKDTQAGAKFMKRELWKKLKKPFICKGFEFDMELLYKAGKIKAKIKEHYIQPNKTDFSTVKARILPGIVYRLLKMRILQ